MGTWKEVAVVNEFEKTDRKLVDLGDGKYIALFKLDDGFFAIDRAWRIAGSSSRTVPNTSLMIFSCQGSNLNDLPWNSPLVCFRHSMKPRTRAAFFSS